MTSVWDSHRVNDGMEFMDDFGVTVAVSSWKFQYLLACVRIMPVLKLQYKEVEPCCADYVWKISNH